MALPAVYFLLLLFSVLPLFDATQCTRRGLYCPVGSDCNNNNTLCEARSDNCTISAGRRDYCDEDITIRFSQPMFDVREDNGPVQPVLVLSRPLDCCSVSVMIKVEDVSAIGNRDYVAPRGGYIQVIIPAGSTTAAISITLTNDQIIEGDEYFEVSIVTESLPHGFTWTGAQSARVYIIDDDSGCVSIERRAYTVNENVNLQVNLRLSAEASFDINVLVEPAYFSARDCDFDIGPYMATFKAGNRQARINIIITDDDIYEGPEGFNFGIGRISNRYVRPCTTYRSSVTITDDERDIFVGFESSSYTIKEDAGTFSPALTLDRPSPCCITVLTKLTRVTGEGFDYGFQPPETYEYVFPPGETCATPDKPIPIIDDRISEVDERFMISIIKLSLPLGVKERRGSATITIKDPDVGCSFEKDEYIIDEDRGLLQVKLKLDKSIVNEFTLQVYNEDDTAIGGVDYAAGPYNVTFKRNSRLSNSFFINIIKNSCYTGNKQFRLIIKDDELPLTLVAGDIATVNVTIVDNEYTVCFDQRSVSVVEGEKVELILATSKRLSGYVRVDLIYSNGTGYPAICHPAPLGSVADYRKPSPPRINDKRDVDITTIQDKILEYNETFAVSIPSDLIHNCPAAADCITTVDVLILNDDCTIVEFEETLYKPPRSKNELLKPVLVLNNPAEYSIQVTLQGENGTAKSGEDYNIQNGYFVIVDPQNTKNYELSVTIIDDDVVETLIEELYVKITYVANRNGEVDENVKIGEKNRTTLQIKDDDECKVSLYDDRLVFSKPIYRNVSIEIQQPTGPSYFDWLPAGKSQYTFKFAIAKNTKFRVCIPKDLFDERSRRVTNGNGGKVEICSLED